MKETTTSRTVRIVVLGDAGVGKTSLVLSLLTEKFPEEGVPGVLPEVAIPSKYNPDNVNVFIADTPAEREDLGARPVHAVVLVYDVHVESSFQRLRSHWLPWLSQQAPGIPVILAGNKIDLRGNSREGQEADAMDNPQLEAQIMPLMAEYRSVETCIECSARQMINVSEVFYFAQKAVIHPSGPLYDPQANVVREGCLAALQRIFRHCDLDGDGFLDDFELDAFQRRCFHQPLQKTDIAGVKETIQEHFPEGVTAQGITLQGFVHLNKMFIQRGRLETTWGILRAFGYNDELHVELPQISLTGDSSLELTTAGYQKLTQLFRRFSRGQDVLTPGQLNELFGLTTEAKVPWLPHFPKSAVLSENGDLPLESFLAQWAMFAFELPFEATAVFTELLGVEHVPKSFKTIPFEQTYQRRVFKIALLSNNDNNKDNKNVLKRFVNESTEDLGVVAVDPFYLILSLNDPEPDLCDVILHSPSYPLPQNLSLSTHPVQDFSALSLKDLYTKVLLETTKKTKWKGPLVATVAALTLSVLLYYRFFKKSN